MALAALGKREGCFKRGWRFFPLSRLLFFSFVLPPTTFSLAWFHPAIQDAME